MRTGKYWAISFFLSKKLGASAYIIYRDENSLGQEEAILPAGVQASSFATEVIAAKHALEKILYTREQGRKKGFRLLTDSRSMVDGLQKSPRKIPSSVQNVSQILSSMSERENCSICIVWIRGHCGLP